MSAGNDGDYPDIDMIWRWVGRGQGDVYLYRDGTPY